jgi:GTP-binding protein Era
MSDETRCGFAAIIGAPNAGKSTLINALTGAKVSIVSEKVQTTRVPVRGIAMHGKSQIIFIDTPGIFLPEKRLERAMVSAAWEQQQEAEALVLVADASRKKIDRDTRAIIERLAQNKEKKPVFLVLNKVDQMKRHELLPRAQEMNDLYPFHATFMISAKNGDGVEDLLKSLAAQMLAGPWMYPEDQVSDMPDRLLAAEITREKLFEKLYSELPYAVTVETESWETLEDGLVIGQVIFVTRESHKPIVLGKGGAQIKSIGEEARRDLEVIFERRVRLNLFVKVRENWTEDSAHYQLWGLDYGA